MRFRRRLSAGLKVLQERPECNADRIAAIGYCIGGRGVLELARPGAALRGVVSLQGFVSAPIPAEQNAVVAKILVLHVDAVYTVKFEKAVYVLHAFQKKSPSGIKTARKDAELIGRRLSDARADYEVRYAKGKS